MKNLKTLHVSNSLHLKTLLMTFILSFFFVNPAKSQVIDGSFEANPIVPLPIPFLAFATYIPGAAMTNWTNTSTSDDLDLHHMSHLSMGSSNLDYHIDLNQFGEATQTGIMLTGGGTYTLSFDVSLHANIFLGSGANAQVELSFGGTPVFTFPISMAKSTASGIAQGWGAPTVSVPIPIPFTGSYDLKFAGTGSSYGSGGILIDNVSLTAPCPPVTISGPTSICSGDIAILNANPAIASNTYTWTPGGATGPSMSTGPLTSTTTYTVTMTDPISGCTSTASYTVNVNPLVVPTFSAVGTYCKGATIPPLPTTSTNGITGTWSPAINNSVTTTYTFTPNPGQCASPTTMTIVIDQCCYGVDFCYTIENKKLTFSSVTPSANVAPCVYRYKWYWGDGTSSATYTTAAAAKAATKTYTSEGIFNVCLEVKRICPGSTDTCCRVICKDIHAIPKCDATVLNADVSLTLKSTAAGTVVTPLITGSAFKSPNGTQITINYGDPSLPIFVANTGTNTFNLTTATRTYANPGIYEYCVTLKYMNALGDSCIDKRCKTILIKEHCATQAYFKISNCASSNTYGFTPIGNATGTNVTWDFGDGTTGVSVNNVLINHTYANPGVYQVCMRIQKGQCYSSACYYVYANNSTITNCGSASALAKPSSENQMNLNEVPLKEILIPENKEIENFSSLAYPNPANQEVNLLLKAPKVAQAKIEMRTSDGRLVKAFTTTISQENSRETIDINSLENGLYLISIEVDGQHMLHKISVVK